MAQSIRSSLLFRDNERPWLHGSATGSFRVPHDTRRRGIKGLAKVGNKVA